MNDNGGLAAWQEVDLTQVQREADEAAESISTRRDASEASRAKLVSAVKNFRSAASDEVRRSVGPLMKHFQQEVDSLTKRSAAAEASFLAVYRRLARAPDPVPLLAAAESGAALAVTSAAISTENERLRATVQELKAEIVGARNQDVTVKQLNERVRDLEAGTARAVEQGLEHARAELEARAAEESRAEREAQDTLRVQLRRVEAEAAAARRALDAAQDATQEVRERAENDLQASALEQQMIAGDLARTQQLVAELQRELEMERERVRGLQAESAAAESSAASSSAAVAAAEQCAALEREARECEAAMEQMAEKHRAAEQRAGLEMAYIRDRVSATEDELTQARSENETLRLNLAARADYSEVCRELQLLKQNELNSVGVDVGNGGGQEAGAITAVATDKSLEAVLLTKNRVLMADVSALKSRLAAETEARREAQLRLGEASTPPLPAITMSSSSSAPPTAAAAVSAATVDVSVPTADTSAYADATAAAAAAAAAAADAVPQPPPPPHVALNVDVTPVGTSAISTIDTSSPDTDSILAAQRDRFRRRNLELEAEVRHVRQTMTALRNDADTLKRDNVKLYEKIKFLSSYRQSSDGVTVASAGAGAGAGASGGGGDNNDVTVRRYGAAYEEGMNPFKAFSSRERAHRIRAMSPLDKAMYHVGRAILGNRASRMAFFVYALILHALVLFVLNRLSHHDTPARQMADLCHSEFAKHMDTHIHSGP